MALDALRIPIVAAPMGGGPSTPALVAAVSGAGGLGFLAGAYKGAEAVREDIRAVRDLTDAPFGVNVFALEPQRPSPDALAAYAATLGDDAVRLGAPLGEPRFDDDGLGAKVEVLAEERPAAVSFALGAPPPGAVARLRAERVAVWATVTSTAEARVAEEAGVDALIAQGVEAGAHRGSFADEDATDEGLTLLVLLQLLRRSTALPLVAAGGIATGEGVAAVLAAGARAAQVGTAFLRCPEAGTSAPHREALRAGRPTTLTRAFTGRRARAIVNRFVADHGADAPRGYPEIHHLTAPLRAAAREAHDAEALHLWAGQAHALAADAPAAEIAKRLADEAAEALDRARRAF